MLGDAHGKQDADAVGSGNLVCHGRQCLCRNARNLLGIFKGERFKRLFVLIAVIHPRVDEVHLRQAAVDNVFRDRGRPHRIGRWVRLEEDVRALGHLVLAQVRDDQPLPAMLVGPLDPRREHRMVLRRIRSDDDD